jgi:hypothetical protein
VVAVGAAINEQTSKQTFSTFNNNLAIQKYSKSSLNRCLFVEQINLPLSCHLFAKALSGVLQIRCFALAEIDGACLQSESRPRLNPPRVTGQQGVFIMAFICRLRLPRRLSYVISFGT